MTRHFLSIFLFFIFLASTNAQDVRLGLKAGVNFSNVAHDDYNTESVTSFHVGGVVEALFSDKIGLQPEILYSEQGFVINNSNGSDTYKISYINVPVLLKYYIFQGVVLEAGPEIGFLNSAKIVSETTDGKETTDIKEGLRTNGLSFDLGLGFQFKNGFNVGARYNWGITNVVKKGLGQNFKNRIIQVSIGYLF